MLDVDRILCYQFAVNLERVAVAQVIVRNLDDRVVNRLKQRAKLQGHSLEHELRQILGRAARPTKEERLALSRRARAMTPPDKPQTDSVELLRQDRHSR